MVLSLIGLGLADETDVSLKGFKFIKDADFVYLETYTSFLTVSKKRLEELYEKNIVECDRLSVEENCADILCKAKSQNVAFLICGDPFCATTHVDLYLRATNMGIKVDVIHNASIINAVGSSGLQLYRFGATVSIPFFEETWVPFSVYDRIKANKDADLHTLCLLDIKMEDSSVGNMKCLKIHEEPRFMTIKESIEQLFTMEVARRENVCDESSLAFGLARIGSNSQKIISGTLEELRHQDFGKPLHSLVICARSLHCLEENFFNIFHCSKI